MCSKGGVGHFERKFHGYGESPTNNCWRQNIKVPGISRSVVCAILRLAVLTQYRRVTDRQMDGHMMTDNTCASIALCKKNVLQIMGAFRRRLACMGESE